MRKKQLRRQILMMDIANKLLQNEMFILQNQLHRAVKDTPLEKEIYKMRDNTPLDDASVEMTAISVGLSSALDFFRVIFDAFDSAVASLAGFTGEDPEVLRTRILDNVNPEWPRLSDSLQACQALLKKE